MSAHVLDRLSEYLDAELEADELDAVKAHLIECSECRLSLEELREMEELARHAPVPELEATPDLATRVRAQLVQDAVDERARWPQWLATAAALAAVIALPWAFLRRQVPEPVMSALEAPVVTDRAAPKAEVVPAPDIPPPAAPEPARAPAQGATGREQKERADRAAESARKSEASAHAESRGAYAYIEGAPPAAQNGSGPTLRDAQSAPEASSADVPEEDQRRLKLAAGGAPAAAPGRPSEEMSGRGEEAAFRNLQARTVSSGEDARRLRRDWRTFVQRFPGSPRADEARFSALAAGARAYRLDRREPDREQLRRDLDEYVASGGRRVEEARQLVEEASEPPSP